MSLKGVDNVGLIVLNYIDDIDSFSCANVASSGPNNNRLSPVAIPIPFESTRIETRKHTLLAYNLCMVWSSKILYLKY